MGRMPQIIASPSGIRIGDGYSIREDLRNLGFRWASTTREWRLDVPEEQPVRGLEMAEAVQGLGAQFAADPYSQELAIMVARFAWARDRLGEEDAREMFGWLLGPEPPDERDEARQCWVEAWEILA